MTEEQYPSLGKALLKILVLMLLGTGITFAVRHLLGVEWALLAALSWAGLMTGLYVSTKDWERYYHRKYWQNREAVAREVVANLGRYLSPWK